MTVPSAAPLPAEAPLLERQSPPCQRLRARLTRVAASPTTPVLLVGPAGSGKRAFARWLHQHAGPPAANAARRPWAELHCGSLAPHELHDALFGVDDGLGPTRGALEEAHGGTLFLREVCRLSLTSQAQLAAFLETETFRRRAGTRAQRGRLRVVASCRRPLAELVERDLVREELYDQLGVFTLAVPPLAESREDVLPLGRFFIEALSAAHGLPLRQLSEEATQRLLAYAYPGNVRELRNIVERALLLAAGQQIAGADIITAPPATPRRGAAFFSIDLQRCATPHPLEHVERQYVARVLKHYRNRRTAAAEALGISYPTFLKRLRELGIGEEIT